MPAIDIEVLYAHLKPRDGLKPDAARVLIRVREGSLAAYASAYATSGPDLPIRCSSASGASSRFDPSP